MTSLRDPQALERPPDSVLASLAFPEATLDPVAAIAASSDDGRVIEEWRPLAESVEARLADSYWRTSGVRAFVHGDVPYVVNNSGWAPASAAAVLFASCEDRDSGGEIAVLELGAGIGLFAREVLDEFHRLCAERGRDFAQRLRYIVTDRSLAMVRDWSDRGQFDPFVGRVTLGVCDATHPRVITGFDGQRIPLPPLHAIFANYVLDQLPMTILRRGPAGTIQQIGVRTRLAASGTALSTVDAPSLTDARWLAASTDERDRTKLLEHVQLLELELSFREEGADALPFAREAIELQPEASRVVLNYGALQCLDACLDLLEPSGFFLLNDYGPTAAEQVTDMAYVQRFGASLAASINFPVLERWLELRGAHVVTPPQDTRRSIHTRLITTTERPELAQTFRDILADARYVDVDGVSRAADAHSAAGRHAEAVAAFREALQRWPRDWNLLGHAAEFCSQRLQRHAEAMELAQAALRINPWHSAFLWNTLGHSHFARAEHAQAHEAFLRAQEIDPGDAQTQLNLAFSFSERGELEAALAAIGRGLAADRLERLRPLLLQKQQQILVALSARRTAHQQALNRRYTAFGAAT